MSKAKVSRKGGTSFQPVSGFRATKRNLPHWQRGGATYFLTCRLREGKFTPSECEVVLRTCLYWHKKKWLVHAATVMPDHVHILVTPLEVAKGRHHSLSEILQRVKGASACAINKMRDRMGALWLDETFDRIVRDRKELEEKWKYIAHNAVKAGLADAPDAYPYYWYEGKEENTG